VHHQVALKANTTTTPTTVTITTTITTIKQTKQVINTIYNQFTQTALHQLTRGNQRTLKNAIDFGRNPTLVSFLGNHVIMRIADGSVIHSHIPPYATVLHAYISTNKWENAIKLCRFVRETYLWAVLAGASIYNKDLDTASIAYAALNEVDKVEYIEHIKQSPNKNIRNAETLLLSGNFRDAENILVQANLIFRAIMMNLNQYNWERF
jgi:intraflagellar transport protein 80